MPFVADIDANGDHVVMYLNRETPLTSSPELKLDIGYSKYHKVQLKIPQDGDNIEVSSGSLESSADSSTLDLEEKTHYFRTFRERAEFAYKEIRTTILEAEKALAGHQHFSSHAGVRSQWAEAEVREETRLGKRAALASARVQRRFSKLPRVIPKARRVLDFDREDGGERVPTGNWSQLSNHELKRIFPNGYDKASLTGESEDLTIAGTQGRIPWATNTSSSSSSSSSSGATERNASSSAANNNSAEFSRESVGDWTEHMNSSGKKYYYNCVSEVSQWEKPREWLDYERALGQDISETSSYNL